MVTSPFIHFIIVRNGGHANDWHIVYFLISKNDYDNEEPFGDRLKSNKSE